MPYRNQVISTGEIYHIFNHSVGKEEIFISKRGLDRTLNLIDYYRFPQKLRYSKFVTLNKDVKENYLQIMKNETPLVDIFSFSIMPNHYHFLIKQSEDRGARRFVSNFQNSLAKYFNLKNNRRGSVFINSFKAKRIETDEEFLHVSRYIHLNPVTSFLIELDELPFYPWTSFGWFVDQSKNRFVNTDLILNNFKSRENYVKFVNDQADYQRKLGIIKRLLLE